MNNSRASYDSNSKPRLRSYSSMNYQEYEDFFGTPPKMPLAPTTKPQQDPLDIPILCLDAQIMEETQEEKKIICYRIKYNIQTIPEVDSSDGNSMGKSQTKIIKNFEFRNCNEMENEGEDELQLISTKRTLVRPRSLSENSIFQAKTRILDFLTEFNNKGNKRIKLE